MGYSTDFTGVIRIEPPLSAIQAGEVARFCEQRYDDESWPSIRCNWRTDGRILRWSGAEKSYAMQQWLQLLVDRFFRPWRRALNGRVLAQGESRDDVWVLECWNNAVVREDVNLLALLKITQDLDVPF